MKVAFLVVTFVHTVMCGHVARTSSLLSPAGVTYVDGSYHAGLAAGPVSYSASAAAAPVATVTASPSVYASAAAVPAGPVAAVSAAPAAYASAPVAAVSTGSSVYASAPNVYASAPAVYASAPGIAAAPAVYASASPVTKYAAVPTVQHVPAVADVPITRINAQPGVIQKTLDVARPALKTQRFEVRRPAIQKQFYDIEERVVVRPAGSAVVELDQPLSRTQKGPSVIRPTGGAVTVSSSESIAVPTGGVAGISTGSTPVSPVDYNLRETIAVPTGPGVAGISTGPTPVSPVDYNLRETSSGALPPAPPTPQAPVVSAPVYSEQASAILPPAAPVQSAAVGAPIHSVPISTPAHTVAIASPAGVSTVSSGSSGLHSISSGSSGPAFSTPAPQYSDDSVTIQSAAYSSPRSGYRLQAHQAGAYQPVQISPNEFHAATPQTYSAPVAVPQTYSAPVFPSRQTIFKSALPTARFSTSIPSSPVRDDSVATYTASSHFLPHQKVRIPAIYSDDSAQSHINQENQQKLIQLLTARGGVTEVGYGRSGAASASYPVDAGEVRGRVISATPAPAYAAPTNERVNTRRVVVSRPIETLQEVEVAEPVTKYERVHVSQPTVIKTASQDVVRVPTSVPVYGKALAPVADETYATLSSEWQ